MSGHFDAQVAVAAVHCGVNKHGGICFACAVKIAKEAVLAGRQQAFEEAAARADGAAETWTRLIDKSMDKTTKLTRRERAAEAECLAGEIRAVARKEPRNG